MLRTRLLGAGLVLIAAVGAVVAFAATTKTAAPAGDKAAAIARGKYLVGVMGCNDCHTPGTFYGSPDMKRHLAGSEVGWQGPWGTSFPRNLTPDLETGLGYWSEAEITKFLRTGNKPDGKQALPPMPWPDTAQLNDADMHALVTYLMSVPKVTHKVPDALPPGAKYDGPTIVIPPPGAWDAPVGAPDAAPKK
jgi:mono/diheme cytochrome c family protein